MRKNKRERDTRIKRVVVQRV